MGIFVDKVSDTRFDVYTMKRQRLYAGATTTKIQSLQVDGTNVIVNCEGRCVWVYGPNDPSRPEQNWRMLRRF